MFMFKFKPNTAFQFAYDYNTSISFYICGNSVNVKQTNLLLFHTLLLISLQHTDRYTKTNTYILIKWTLQRPFFKQNICFRWQRHSCQYKLSHHFRTVTSVKHQTLTSLGWLDQIPFPQPWICWKVHQLESHSDMLLVCQGRLFEWCRYQLHLPWYNLVLTNIASSVDRI